MGFCLNLKKIIVCSVIGGGGGDYAYELCVRWLGGGGVVGELGLWIVCSVIGGRGELLEN